MKMIIQGPVTIVGNNIDTDQIYPGRYLAITDPKEIGLHCLEGVDGNIAPKFPKGGIVVAGTNFGCGSSREHAPIALINMGASCVVAESFARIFFRNSINLGLPLITCKGISSAIKQGDSMRVDLEKGFVTLLLSSVSLPCDRFDGQAKHILAAGGIKPLMRQRMEKLKEES